MDDTTLLARFESLELAPGEFRHREHIRVAFAMLRGAEFGEAALRFRTGLKRFATAAGVPGKYDETLTWAYLALVARCMAERDYPSSLAMLEARPDLLGLRVSVVAEPAR